jgi:hypothetical protein
MLGPPAVIAEAVEHADEADLCLSDRSARTPVLTCSVYRQAGEPTST